MVAAGDALAWTAGAFAAIVIYRRRTPARAQDATLGADRFHAGGVADRSASGALHARWTDDARDDFFSAGRCACPTSYGVTLALTSEGAAKLAGDDDLDATVMIGSDCDNVRRDRLSVAWIHADPDRDPDRDGRNAVDQRRVRRAGAGQRAARALPATSSRLWAIVRLNGARLDEPAVGHHQPGRRRPQAADGRHGPDRRRRSAGVVDRAGGQLVAAGLPGVVLARAQRSTGRRLRHLRGRAVRRRHRRRGLDRSFASLDSALICSGLVSAGTISVRVHGLQNGSTYQVAVVSVGGDGTASAPSASAEATPGPTLGFDDIYKEAGGDGLGGCATAAGRASTVAGRSRSSPGWH